MTSHYTRGSVITLHGYGGVLGRPLDTFFWALWIFMVTALGSCVEWPLGLMLQGMNSTTLLHWLKVHGWGPGHIWLHTTLEGLWPHYMVVEVCWDGLWTLFFWALTFFMVTALGSCVKWPLRLRTTSHMSQELWPCNGEDPWLSSKGRTMSVGKAVTCSLGPSSIVWSEWTMLQDHCILCWREKEGRILFNIICFKLYQFKRIMCCVCQT